MTASPEDTSPKLRLGGMALANGLLVHGPGHWAAAVRAPNGEIRTATANLEAIRAQRAALEVKVSNLRPEHVDPDLLDERIRATLNLVSPDDIVLMQPTTAR